MGEIIKEKGAGGEDKNILCCFYKIGKEFG